MLYSIFSISLSVVVGFMICQLLGFLGLTDGQFAMWFFVSVACLFLIGSLLGVPSTRSGIMRRRDYVFISRMLFFAGLFSIACLAIYKSYRLNDTISICLAVTLLAISSCAFLVVRKRAYPHQYQTDASTIESFRQQFGFDPQLLNQVSYQREVLLRLAMIAVEVRATARQTVKQERSVSARMVYDQVYLGYEKALSLVKHFNVEFANQIPHWTQLPEYIDGWLEEKAIRSLPEIKLVKARTA
jgi:hypothetical protein